MSYPTVKAGTTHVDAGTDSPKQARSDIKQNIDNVNALIDHFNGTGPISIQDNEITSTRSNDDLILQASGTGKVSSPETINFNTLGRVIITDQAAGTFSTESSSSIGMLYNNGIQVEAAGNFEYPALVLKTHSVNGYPNIWASRSKNNTFGQNTHLEDGDTIFRFFGAGFDGTDYNTAHCTVDFLASQDHTGSAQGGKIVMSTATNGTKTSAARLTLDDDVTSEVRLEFNKNYKEKITALSSATTIAVDCSLGTVFTSTLSHNANFVLSNLNSGESVVFIITQDSDSTYNTASFYAADSTAVKFPTAQSVSLTQANGAIDMVVIFNDGTNLLGTINNNFGG